MKKTFKNILSAIALLALAAACGNSDDPSPTPTPPLPTGTFNGIIFATSITNAEGNSGSNYMQTLDDMKAGNYDNKSAMPIGFGTTPIVMTNGHVYALPDYMGNTKAEIVRYDIAADGQFVRKGAMPIPAGAAACCVVEQNDSKAYVSLQKLGLVMVFNPSTMTKIKDINLNSLSHEDASVAPAAMVVRGEELFVGLNQFNAQWMPVRNEIELALIDTRTDQLKKHIRNATHGLSFATRPIYQSSIFVDEEGDIYFNCMGAFGFNPQYPGGIARIRKGSDEIDPDYCIRLDKTPVEGLSTTHGDYIGMVCYGGKGKLYMYVNSYALDPAGAANPYMCRTVCPVVADLKAKTMRLIPGMEVGNPQGIAIARYKDGIVFGSANAKANGFYLYHPATDKTEGPIMNVQGHPCFFYSFVK